MAATVDKVLVQARGHKIPEDYPFILDSSLETKNKTKEVQTALQNLGFKTELERSLIKKVRAGLGKVRGRKYQRKKGLLIVVADDCPLLKSARNIAGVDVVLAKGLNAELLAPGAKPGRATLWTEKAIEIIKNDNLFN